MLKGISIWFFRKLKSMTNAFKAWLVKLALANGWVWPMKLRKLMTQPRNGYYNQWKDDWGPKGYEPVVLYTRDDVVSAALVFGLSVDEIPWDQIEMPDPEKREFQNRSVHICFNAQEQHKRKLGFKIRKVIREVDFVVFWWDVNTYQYLTRMATI